MAIAKRKKRFFEVDIPIIKKSTQLQAFEKEELNNRLIQYDLTRMLRGKGTILQLITKVNKESATSIPRQLKLMPFYLKRMVRKGTSYVEDSFTTDSQDAQLKIKPFLITRRKVSRRIRNALRTQTKLELEKYANEKQSSEIFEDILKNQLQKKLSLTLKKIYPLSLCEIKFIKVMKFSEKKALKDEE